jgi:hypothetical protein
MGKAFAPRRLPLKPFSHLGLDDRAENVKAAAGLGINSVLFDTVEKDCVKHAARTGLEKVDRARLL